MHPGESKKFKVSPDKAFGHYRKELIFEMDRKDIPAEFKLEIGQQFQINLTHGLSNIVRVARISEMNITLDANHPLAGKDLFFDIKLIEIM